MSVLWCEVQRIRFLLCSRNVSSALPRKVLLGESKEFDDFRQKCRNV